MTDEPIEHVRAVIDEQFRGLWPAVDVGLAVSASLLLRGNRNPVAVIYVGGPSSSKTTVADMFADESTMVVDGGAPHPLFYLSDSFTAAAFVSHAANLPAEKLAKVDLLPRIKHKVLVTPELAPTFRGKDDDLVKVFKIITRVLDGQGLMTDGGTQGRRGYHGDYLFAWLGCTTPFDQNVWRVMGQLGSRLFFYVVQDDADEVTVEMLLGADDGADYGERLDACKTALQAFIADLYRRHGGVRGVRWNTAGDPMPVQKAIALCGKLLAAARSEPTREAPEFRDEHEYVPAKIEQPWRAHAVLRNLARGHAIVHGRTQLLAEDLGVVARVTVSSMPPQCGRVVWALVEKGAPLTTSDVVEALGVKHHDTARKVMLELAGRGVMTMDAFLPGRAGEIEFAHRWAWFASPEFRAALLGEPFKNPGVCGSLPDAANDHLSPIHLAENEVCEVMEVTGGTESGAHTPGKMTGPHGDSLDGKAAA